MLDIQKYLTVVSLYLILVFGVVACVVQQNPVSGTQRAFGYSWQQELQLGEQADEEISSHYGLYEDDELAAYITGLSEEILQNSHMRRDDTDAMFRETEFTFRVLNSPVVNAFALPGGYVYVTRGLLAHLNNEAQLAVVIGHEIAHVAARHASQRAFNQQMGQIALIGGAIVSEEFLGLPGQDILGLGGTAAQLLFLRHSRDHERESDRLGVEYAALTGYRAHEGSEFFRTLQRLTERTGAAIPNFLSTHPDPGNREQAIIEMSNSRQDEGLPMDMVNQDQFLDHIDGIIVGNNPRSGFIESGIFYHPDNRFQLTVPADWQQIYEGNQLVLIEQNEEAIIVFQQAEGVADAQEAVDQFGTQEGVQVTQKEQITTGGLPAWLLRAHAKTEDGELEFMVFGIKYNNDVFRFVSYSAAENFRRYENIFTTTITSFEELTDQNILNINPARLRTVTTDRDGSFESFLPSTLPYDLDAQEVAIINQVEMDETIAAGTRLKLPEQ